MGNIICCIGGLGWAVIVSCIYWVFVRWIPDGEASDDAVDSDFRQLSEN